MILDKIDLFEQFSLNENQIYSTVGGTCTNYITPTEKTEYVGYSISLFPPNIEWGFEVKQDNSTEQICDCD